MVPSIYVYVYEHRAALVCYEKQFQTYIEHIKWGTEILLVQVVKDNQRPMFVLVQVIVTTRFYQIKIN